MFVQPSVEQRQPPVDGWVAVKLLHPDGPVKVMNRIEPLLSKVPHSLLREALDFGQTVDDPVVRCLCRLFANPNH